jgi:ElaB/YqjD/DUF883 family membrane-anchored ribosome-binding protein
MDATTTEQLMAELRAVAREAEELLQATAEQTGERVEELRERAKAALAAARICWRARSAWRARASTC